MLMGISVGDRVRIIVGDDSIRKCLGTVVEERKHTAVIKVRLDAGLGIWINPGAVTKVG